MSETTRQQMIGYLESIETCIDGYYWQNLPDDTKDIDSLEYAFTQLKQFVIENTYATGLLP